MAGMSLLNISLDTLRPDRFEQMTRRRGLERVLETIQEAVDLGFKPVKVNMTNFPIYWPASSDTLLHSDDCNLHQPL